ncbi:CHAT domain-containing protein [Mycena leptocephala]|nr:CHAT domain-containing protein [Mycena leptocephala]
MWAKYTKLQEDPLGAFNAYSVAMDLLPELVWLGLSIRDRHHHLLKASEVVRHAAAVAIALGHFQQAVEWLEQGRSVIWNQLLNLRTPVDILDNSHPELAQQLLSLSFQLDGSGTHVSDLEPTKSTMHQSPQSSANQAHQNALAREQLLQKIRELKGFERFLLPKTISELSQAAQHGPVVILNSTHGQCDALILIPGLDDDVMHVALTNAKPMNVESMAQSLCHLVRGGPERIVWKREGQMNPEEEFAQLLSELWLGIVKPVLEGLAMVAFVLPQSHRDHCSSLLLHNQPHLANPIFLGPKKRLIVFNDWPMEDFYLDSVKEGMRNSGWVHFACHGVQDVQHPTESALLLAGSSKLTLSNLIQLALPHAELAFLSACQTAMGDKPLQEESVHLAAGMLSAGYRGVIATMWTIMDRDAPQVASEVYEHLFKTLPPDTTQAAKALHLAVQKLQKGPNKKPFFHWVPFIHVGV